MACIQWYGVFWWNFFFDAKWVGFHSVSKSVSTEPNYGILVSNFMLPINILILFLYSFQHIYILQRNLENVWSWTSIILILENLITSCDVSGAGLRRTLVYSVKCPICMQMEMGPKIGLCQIPLWTESVKFCQRSNPCCIHKWLSVARSDPCAYVLWLLTRACQPQKLYPEIFY